MVPGSQLVVSRTAYRNSQILCGKWANSVYAEVSALLKSHSIDLDHNRFLILQGEVESIAQMKAKASSGTEEGFWDLGGYNWYYRLYCKDQTAAAKVIEAVEESYAEKAIPVRSSPERMRRFTEQKGTCPRTFEQEKYSIQSLNLKSTKPLCSSLSRMARKDQLPARRKNKRKLPLNVRNLDRKRLKFRLWKKKIDSKSKDM